jgi:hypothetical protein
MCYGSSLSISGKGPFSIISESSELREFWDRNEDGAFDMGPAARGVIDLEAFRDWRTDMLKKKKRRFAALGHSFLRE